MTSTENPSGTVTFTNCCCCGAGVTVTGCDDGVEDGALVTGWSVKIIGEALGPNDGSIDDSLVG